MIHARYFNWQTAFSGMVFSFICMLYVDSFSASISCFILVCLFAWIHYTCPPKTWGDVMQSLIYHQVRKYLLRLDSRKDHVKFWRPQVTQKTRLNMADFDPHRLSPRKLFAHQGTTLSFNHSSL
jgi:hypothetical protein